MAALQTETPNTNADSGDSSPRSRGTDCDNSSLSAAWDDLPPPLPPLHHSLSQRHGHGLPHHRVKFLCSYGGRIQPRPHHDHQLAYVGGDTKIVAVDRSVRFPQLLSRLSALVPSSFTHLFCFKYQLPGEDLDALISVTNDDDIDHMMLEYDRLQRSSAKPSRLRLFLFPVLPAATAFPSDHPNSCSDPHWFVDALNSMPAPPNQASPPVPAVGNPDFLFGLDNESANFPCLLTIQDLAAPEAKADAEAEADPIDDVTPATTGSDNSVAGGDDPPAVHRPEIQRRQIQEQQRGMRDGDAVEILSGVPHYLPSKVEVAHDNAPTVPPFPVAYLHGDGGVYSSIARLDHPVYFIPSPATPSVYPGTVLRALTSHAYYAPTHQSVAYMVPPPPPQPSAKTLYLVRPSAGTGGGSAMPAACPTGTANSGDAVRCGATSAPAQLATTGGGAPAVTTTPQLLNGAAAAADL